VIVGVPLGIKLFQFTYGKNKEYSLPGNTPQSSNYLLSNVQPKHMTSPNHAIVKLVPAVRIDVARIAEITAKSLDATPASQFLFKPGVYRDGRRDAAVTAYFIWRTEAAFDDPTAEVIKAVDQGSGEILGFATWQFVEKSASSADPGKEAIQVSHNDRGGGEDEPAIVKDVNMDLMRDYFTSTGYNQAQITNAVGVDSSACKFYAALLQ
jgi:hypothetical protein